VSDFSDIVTVFGRNRQTGSATKTSCIAAALTGCRRVPNFMFPSSIAISPNGRYANVPSPSGVDVFSRQL
jgi:hypothetical protein